MTFLHYAYAITYAKAPVIHDLIEAGAEVNAKDKSGKPILVLAVISGNIPVIKALLDDLNTNIMAKNLKGQTALDIVLVFNTTHSNFWV